MISRDFLNKVNKVKRAPNMHKIVVLENIIYSNELVNDIKLLRKSNSLESLDNYINNRSNDINYLNLFINKDEKNIKIKKNLLSFEGIDYENYYNKGQNFIQLIIRWIEILWKKFLAFILGIIKKIKMMWFGLVRKKLSEIEKEFDASKFIHMDHEVTNLKSLTNNLKSYLGIFDPEYGKYAYITFKDDVNQVLKNLTTPISSLMDTYLKASKDELPTIDEIVNNKEYDLNELYNNKFNNSEMFIVKLSQFAPDNVEKESVVRVGLRTFFTDLFFRSDKNNHQTNTVWTVENFLKCKANQRPVLLDALKDYKNDSDDMKVLEKIIKKMKVDYQIFKSNIQKQKYGSEEDAENLKSLREIVSCKIQFLTMMSKELESFYVIKARILASIGKAVLIGQGYNKDSEVEFA